MSRSGPNPETSSIRLPGPLSLTVRISSRDPEFSKRMLSDQIAMRVGQRRSGYLGDSRSQQFLDNRPRQRFAAWKLHRPFAGGIFRKLVGEGRNN